MKYLIVCCFSYTADMPRRAVGNVIGSINGIEFSEGRLYANITRTGKGTKVTGELLNLPREVGEKHMHNAICLTI